MPSANFAAASGNSSGGSKAENPYFVTTTFVSFVGEIGPGGSMWATIDVTLMTMPPPESIIAGTMRFSSTICEKRSPSTVRSMSSIGVSRNGWLWPGPR